MRLEIITSQVLGQGLHCRVGPTIMLNFWESGEGYLMIDLCGGTACEMFSNRTMGIYTKACAEVDDVEPLACKLVFKPALILEYLFNL